MKTPLTMLIITVIMIPAIDIYIHNQIGEYDIENYLLQEVPLIAPEMKEYQFGIASWYDYSLPEVPLYSKIEATGASRDFPKGTLLDVCSIIKTRNFTGGEGTTEIFRCVRVIINDYGPEERTGRIIDLSSYAFQQLAPLSVGVINVEIYEQ